jgi:hypothetical protein
MPESAIPSMKERWAQQKNTTRGDIERRVAAINIFHLVLKSPRIRDKPTVKVRVISVLMKISGKR